MPTGAPSTQKIIDAWTGVQDRWTVRRNKARAWDGQWEVLHSWGDPEVIDQNTQRVVERYLSEHAAHARAYDLEMLARAGAVQTMFVEWNKK